MKHQMGVHTKGVRDETRRSHKSSTPYPVITMEQKPIVHSEYSSEFLDIDSDYFYPKSALLRVPKALGVLAMQELANRNIAISKYAYDKVGGKRVAAPIMSRTQAAEILQTIENIEELGQDVPTFLLGMKPVAEGVMSAPVAAAKAAEYGDKLHNHAIIVMLAQVLVDDMNLPEDEAEQYVKWARQMEANWSGFSSSSSTHPISDKYRCDTFFGIKGTRLLSAEKKGLYTLVADHETGIVTKIPTIASAIPTPATQVIAPSLKEQIALLEALEVEQDKKNYEAKIANQN